MSKEERTFHVFRPEVHLVRLTVRATSKEEALTKALEEDEDVIEISDESVYESTLEPDEYEWDVEEVKP